MQEINLTPFERLEILREEEEARSEELKSAQNALGELLYAEARAGFLQSLSSYYPPAAPEQARRQELQLQLQKLSELVALIRQNRERLEKELGPGTAGRGAPGAGQRVKFDSFEDFQRRYLKK